MAIKICPICGSSYTASPSGNKTCSRACSIKLRSMSHIGVSNTWSDASRKRLRARPTPPQLSLGVQAAMMLPESQRGPQHRESKIWRLVDPDGTLHVVVGLEDWCRHNADLFGEDPEHSGRICWGFRQIARWMRGKTKRTVSSYKGWTLDALPVDKEDTP